MTGLFDHRRRFIASGGKIAKNNSNLLVVLIDDLILVALVTKIIRFRNGIYVRLETW